MNNNMWSRFRIVLAMIGLSVLLSGCGVDLTDEQNRIIAEYAADLLLKYDAEYQAKYGNTELDSEEDTSDITEDVTEDLLEDITTERDTEDTSEPDIDVITTESTEEENTTSDDNSNTTDDPEDTASSEQMPDSTTEEMAQTSTEEDTAGPPSSSDNVTDIAEIVDISGLSITYNKCMFLDRYPSIDQDGAFIYLDADPGYKLAVIKFSIENHTSESIMLDLLNTDIDYRLVMNGSKAAKPMLTILMDDLGTFSNAIPGNNDQSAVLVFQISEKSMQEIQKLDMKVMYNKKEYVIHIQ